MAAALGDEAQQWFGSRTFGPSPLSIERLQSLRTERGVSISVCMPALNEAQTIGGLCRLIRRELVDAVPFVHEVVVVDSGSEDDTPERAAAEGAKVHHAADLVLAPDQPVLGKGDVLWRSLSVLEGDIVVWIDSDVREPHVGFVTGLVAPLLMNHNLVFAKAFYERPLHVEGERLDEGGRVTEMVARPLINLFYPSLAGVIQPLSGECATYRDLLLDLPFATGYGVDIGLLLDIAEQRGLDSIAQVDLGRRLHRNRTTRELGRMASQVMQAMFGRLDRQGRLKLADELPSRLVQFDRGEGGPAWEEHDVGVVERPPMRRLAARGGA